jgi:hypothetical protein
LQINFIGKHPEYPDAPMLFPSRDYQPFNGLSINREIVHEYLREMNREVLSVSLVLRLPGGVEVTDADCARNTTASREHFHSPTSAV